MKQLKIGIIGAGLGGLLAGAYLAKQGNHVVIFEKLDYAGGRFTNINHKGFQLSTGALHMIPHVNGPLARMLSRLGANVKIVPCSPPGLFRINGRDYTHRQLPELFGAWNKLKLAKLMNDLTKGSGGDETYLEWVRKRISHKKVFDLANSFCRWALSLDADEVSSREIVAISKNVAAYGGPAIPMGGCAGISGELANMITSGGGEIHLKTPVKRIAVENGRASGIETGENFYELDVVISNAGPKATLALCGENHFDAVYVRTIKSIKEARGIKLCFQASKAMLRTTAPVFTPDAERIGGMNEVTNADPSLAPSGMHLIMAHQKLYGREQSDIKKEIEEGMEDIKKLIPEFEKYCSLLIPQVYKENNPVNRACSGMHIPFTTPVKNLYNVGDGIKPEGYVETDGVAKGVELMLEHLQSGIRKEAEK